MKLIAIDLDGTLLNKESVISAENRAAIKRAVDARYPRHHLHGKSDI